MDTFACRAVVIGGGVIGLAVAQRLAERVDDLWLVEAASGIGTGISSRSSEVVHAGIYYPSGSLKATTCVRGRVLLYDFCARHGVPVRRCGKLIVATEEAQIAVLEGLLAQGCSNGVTSLQWLDGTQARVLEPAVHAVCALSVRIRASSIVTDTCTASEMFCSPVEASSCSPLRSKGLNPVPPGIGCIWEAVNPVLSRRHWS